ncbi:MAG: sulfatase-like hydrolase/transferase, partial [gamma proteobacterium symbiont of Bathyaustriella thionipta]|nr:sulfatase-like hydrolase/transferase [gamma proteobacterium symbiont of Bathyaustriella thionipta]
MLNLTRFYRFQLYFLLYVLLIIISLVTRIGLMVWYQSEIDSSISIYPALFLIGWLYDTAFYWYASIPLIFVLWLTPEKIWHSNVFQLLMKLWVIISIYILCFVVVSEFIFWDEFQVRFNFISVDYLVYRKEVMDNIQESYPVFTLLILMLPVTLMIFLSINKILEKTLKVNSSFSQRTVMTLALFISLFAVFKGVDQSQHSLFENNYTKELASNGPYQFFASFRNNELEYTQFYQEIDNLKADKIIRNSLKNGYSTFLYPDQLFNIERKIDNPGTEKKLNVILISIESLSAKYVGSFGNTENITPFLDQFSKESLFFTDFYATGTRTTRGLEAITLSIPPTPGRSVVKRIGHEGDMWSLGNILKSKGYQTTFIYGGRGY